MYIVQVLGWVDADLSGASLYAVIAYVLLIVGVLVYAIYRQGLQKKFSGGGEVQETVPHEAEAASTTGDAELDEIIKLAGYAYDPGQDIFYSAMYPWQRDMGYCRLYDEASAAISLIMDCEPIYFDYGGKRWMIEFWKGQYGMTSGGEIGIYNTEKPDLDIPELFTGPFFSCASDEERLYMSYTLMKNGKVLFTRRDKHWWLTGFKLGEFSEPSELSMQLYIALKDDAMRRAFIEGLKKAGYREGEIYVDEINNIVGVLFDKPRTLQPFTRIPETDWITQRKSELLCKAYMDITAPYDRFPDKIRAIREQAPEIYNAVVDIGKTRKLLEVYGKIKKYLS